MGLHFKWKFSYRYSTPEMQKFLQADRVSKLNLKHPSANTSYGSSWIEVLNQNLTCSQGQRPKTEYPHRCQQYR